MSRSRTARYYLPLNFWWPANCSYSMSSGELIAQTLYCNTKYKMPKASFYTSLYSGFRKLSLPYCVLMLTSVITIQAVFHKEWFLLRKRNVLVQIPIECLAEISVFGVPFSSWLCLGFNFSLLVKLVLTFHCFILWLKTRNFEIRMVCFPLEQVFFLFNAGTLMTWGYLPSVRSRRSPMASTATCIELSFKYNIENPHIRPTIIILQMKVASQQVKQTQDLCKVWKKKSHHPHKLTRLHFENSRYESTR